MEKYHLCVEGFESVGLNESINVSAGKSETIADIIEIIGIGVGGGCKLLWKFLKASQKSLYEQARNGEQIIYK